MIKTVVVDTFIPRDYQLPFVEAFENQRYNRYVLCWARRTGKDICAFNLLFRAALRRTAVYFYILPTYSQARKVIWDSITSESIRFLDFINRDLIAKSNSQEMKITLINGSIIQLIGSDNINSIMGTNPAGAVFSEYAMQSEIAYQYLRPIFLANGGWMVFVSTPRAKNSFYDMYKTALNNPDTWFCSFLTVEDTKHISIQQIQSEIDEGIMSYDIARQEYWCDFTLGSAGSFYGKHIEKMTKEERITTVPYDPSLPVHTAWDIGINDPTVVIFAQIDRGGAIKIIDYYEKTGTSLEAHIKTIKEKEYTYGNHIGPHDIRQRELSTGITRWEKAHSLGITFRVAPGIKERVFIQDGIEAVRTIFNRLYIDYDRCRDLIRHLENYRQEYDNEKKVYKPNPVHDSHSHAADCLRYLCTSLHLLGGGMTQEDIDKAKQKARMSQRGLLPKALRR